MLEHVTWFRQAAVRWQDAERTVYVDPWGTGDDPPPADLILITHAHFDHFRPDEIEKLRCPETRLIAPLDVANELTGDVTPVRPGETYEVGGVRIATVPAYNTREEALDFHPKANRWVGYVLEIGGHTYYHAGDTDHIHELESVRADVAFVPIGGTYTMDVQEAAGFVKAINPGLAVPMHYGHVEGVGVRGDAQRFAAAAAPIPVEILSPTVPQAG